MGSETVLNHPYATGSVVIEETTAASADRKERSHHRGALDWRQVLGGVAIAAGLIALIGGWIGMSGTTDLSAQLTYMFSGGFGGAGLLAVGATFLVGFEHHADRIAIRELDHEIAVLQAEVRSIGEQSRSAPESNAKGLQRSSRRV